VNTAKKRPDPVQHTFSLTVSVDPFWVEYLTQNVDIFGQQYAGYWLRGVEHDPELGWLVWEGRRAARPTRLRTAGASVKTIRELQAQLAALGRTLAVRGPTDRMLLADPVRGGKRP
jgi:hypothetical protein